VTDAVANQYSRSLQCRIEPLVPGGPGCRTPWGIIDYMTVGVAEFAWDYSKV
jgi:hypothetical protein